MDAWAHLVCWAALCGRWRSLWAELVGQVHQVAGWQLAPPGTAPEQG